MINEFRGRHFFLSNFFSSPVCYRGITFCNAEAAFHAQKDPSRAEEFARLSPSEAKRLGRRVRLRPDWEKIKDAVMFEVVLAKFESSPSLKRELLATGDERLVEENTWGDSYCGVCGGVGLNRLGETLEKVRALLRSQEP